MGEDFHYEYNNYFLVNEAEFEDENYERNWSLDSIDS